MKVRYKMRVELEFFDHAGWSDKKAEINSKKIVKFLDENKIDYFQNEDDSDRVDGFTVDVTREEYSKLFAFLTQDLKANPRCIHIPYQTVFLIGNGNYEFTNYTPEVDALARENWGIRKLPRVDFLEPKLKCVFCHGDAEFMYGGSSMCAKDFSEVVKQEKKTKEVKKKETQDVVKELNESVSNLSEKLEKSFNQGVKPREKQEMYR